MSAGNAAGADPGSVVAGTAAFVSWAGVWHEYPFHEMVGTIAGCMAITYYAYQFVRWGMHIIKKRRRG